MDKIELQDSAKVLYDGGWRSSDPNEDWLEYYDPETQTEEEFKEWLEAIRAELRDLEEEKKARTNE